MGGAESSTGAAAPVATSPVELAVGQCFDELADSDQVVTAAAFEHLFSGPVPGFGSRLFRALFPKDEPRISKPVFVSAMARLLGRDSRQSGSVLSYLSVFVEKERVRALPTLTCACKLAIRLSAADGGGGEGGASDDLPSCHFLQAVSQTICSDSEPLTSALGLGNMSEWVLSTMPGMFDSMHAWLERSVWSSSSGQASDLGAFALPQLASGAGAPIASDILTPDAVWVLSTFLPPCYLGHHKATAGGGGSVATSSTGASAGGQWNLLYNSRDQGLSLNRFKHHVLDYRGPSVCCIRCDGDAVFALAVDCEWRESSSSGAAWGGGDCTLTQLRPRLRPLAAGARLLVLNERTRGVRLGLSVGRDLSRPALVVDENLDKLTVQAAAVGGMPDVLSVRAVEVWGCGGADLQAAQRKQKEWDKTQVERRRQVKRPGRWEENPDALLLEWGGVHATSNFGHDRSKGKDKK